MTSCLQDALERAVLKLGRVRGPFRRFPDRAGSCGFTGDSAETNSAFTEGDAAKVYTQFPLIFWPETA